MKRWAVEISVSTTYIKNEDLIQASVSTYKFIN